MLVIEVVTHPTREVLDSVTRLLPLLSKSTPAPTPAELAEIVGSSATTLFVARDTAPPAPATDTATDTATAAAAAPIVGTLTLALFRIPSGVRAWIEDVIVAEEARGKGCGEALTKAALAAAQDAGARTVELTSRPSRESANRLYRRMGFVERETNVYRFDLELAGAEQRKQ